MIKEKKINILLIEEDTKQAIKIANVLNNTKQFNTLVASCGSIGIQKAFQKLPNIIICSIFLSDIDGYQVLKTLKESSITTLIPFIFVTSKSKLSEIRLGMQLGADDYIVKPFKNEELLISIKTRVNKYEEITKLYMDNFNNLLNLSPNPVFINNKTKFIKINFAFTKIFGYTLDDLKNKSIIDIVAEEDKEKANDFKNKVLSGIYEKLNCNVNIIRKNSKKLSITVFCKSSTDIYYQTIMIGYAICNNNEEIDKISANNIIEKNSSTYHKKGKLVSSDIGKQLKLIYNIDNYNNNPLEVEDVKLTKREKEVLFLSCKGLLMKQIANLLCISTRTVEKHRTNLMKKTNTKNIAELIVFSIKNNLIDI